MAESQPTKDNIFEKVVDIAQAAQQARENAARASQKANYVEELATQARRESDHLKRLAANLAATAASTAQIAMEVSEYHNISEAYQAKQTLYEDKLDYDAFIDVLTTGCRCKQTIPDDELDSIAEVEEQQTMRRLKKIKLSSYATSSEESGSESKMYQAKVVNLSPTSSLSPAALKKRGSYSDTSDQGREVCSSTSNSATRLLKDPLMEKFPSSGSTIEQKEVLAATFASTGNIDPLWEDRYVDSKASSGKPTQSIQPETWEEKKALRRFQFKLQSLDDRSSHDVEIGKEKKEEAGTRDKPMADGKGRQRSPRQDKRSGGQRHDIEQQQQGGYSSDEEVTEIMRQPKVLRTVKALERQNTDALMSSPQYGQRHSPRSLSPLLSSSEKALYSTCKISTEESSCPSKVVTTKHKYIPPIPHGLDTSSKMDTGASSITENQQNKGTNQNTG